MIKAEMSVFFYASTARIANIFLWGFDRGVDQYQWVNFLASQTHFPAQNYKEKPWKDYVS